MSMTTHESHNFPLIIENFSSSNSQETFDLVNSSKMYYLFRRPPIQILVFFLIAASINYLTKHKLLDDIEAIFIEVNLRKIKWLIFGISHPPGQPVEYFFKHVGYALDIYKQIYEKFLVADDFNTEVAEPCLSEFLTKYDSKTLVKEKTCFKISENPICIDLFMAKSIGRF